MSNMRENMWLEITNLTLIKDENVHLTYIKTETQAENATGCSELFRAYIPGTSTPIL